MANCGKSRLAKTTRAVESSDPSEDKHNVVTATQESAVMNTSLICWRKGLILFAVYYALLFIGAAIIMYIEANALQAKSAEDTVNITKPLQHLLESEFQLALNESSLLRIMNMSNQLYEKSKKIKDRKWKKSISWSTLLKWRHFTQITLTTVGKKYLIFRK